MDGTANSPSSGWDKYGVVAVKKEKKKMMIKPEVPRRRQIRNPSDRSIKPFRKKEMKVESKNMKSEGLPVDSWSWRKYGQKPIKGSPFPRGYYRCSTSKGCSAKKQVERCKTDSSIVIITYTSDHNHPSPHSIPSSSMATSELPITPKKEYQDPEQQHSEEPTTDQEDEQKHHIFHCSQSPLFNNNSFITRDEEYPFGESLVVFEGELDQVLLDDHQLLQPSVTSEQKNDSFFDELEELSTFTSSSFSRFMRGSLFDLENILVNPS